MHTSILVDGACNLLYGSYYLKGLKQFFGQKWRFAERPFSDLDASGQVLHIIIREGDTTIRLAIDHSNLPHISERSLDWSDVYGKVNLRPEDLNRKKVVPVGPLTGLRIRSVWWTYCMLVLNLIRSRRRIPDRRIFISLYRGQLRRPRLKDLVPKTSKPDYLFFAGTIWKKEKDINEFRANYIRAIRRLERVKAEGGFAPRIKKDIPDYASLEMPARLDEATYMRKTAESMAVFHTPSVAGCNGWKLCEFLMMGKAILSIPMVRVMPEGFISGKTYLLSDGSENDILDKLARLRDNDAMRLQLEKNARHYYETVISPAVVIQKLVEHAKSSMA